MALVNTLILMHSLQPEKKLRRLVKETLEQKKLFVAGI